MDILTLKQEEKIKNLEEEISILNQECKEKESRYKRLDEIYLSVIKVIEEHKKNILNLKNKIKIKESEEKNNRMIIFQKEQEILLLRNFINSYKSDIKNKYRSLGDNIKSKIMNDINYYKPKEFLNLHKNKSSINIKNGSTKLNNLQNRNNLPKVELKTNNYNKNAKLTDSNYLKNKKYPFEINEKEEENFKEIKNLMKKMINE